MPTMRDFQMMQQGLSPWKRFAQERKTRGLLSQMEQALGKGNLTEERIMEIAKESNDPMNIMNNMGMLSGLNAKKLMEQAGRDMIRAVEGTDKTPAGEIDYGDLAEIGMKHKLGPENTARLIKQLSSVGAIPSLTQKYTFTNKETGQTVEDVSMSSPLGKALHKSEKWTVGEYPSEYWKQKFREEDKIPITNTKTGLVKEMPESKARNFVKRNPVWKIGEYESTAAKRKFGGPSMTEAEARKRISEINKTKAKLEQGTSALRGFLNSNPEIARNTDDPVVQQGIQSLLSGEAISKETKEKMYRAFDEEEQYLRKNFLGEEMQTEVKEEKEEENAPQQQYLKTEKDFQNYLEKAIKDLREKGEDPTFDNVIIRAKEMAKEDGYTW